MSNSKLEDTNEPLVPKEEVLADMMSGVFTILLTVIRLLRQQPSFDNQKFLDDLRALSSEATNTNSYTKMFLSRLLEILEVEDNH